LILDTSAIVAVGLEEPGYKELQARLAAAPIIAVGTPTLVETTMVLSARLRLDARGMVARFLIEMHVVVIPFTEAHYATAIAAWFRFGRGRHPAGLNLGDCFSYAIARVAREPLLFTGNDFAQTDIEAA
jgi:ribonuclease VapC